MFVLMALAFRVPGMRVQACTNVFRLLFDVWMELAEPMEHGKIVQHVLLVLLVGFFVNLDTARKLPQRAPHIKQLLAKSTKFDARTAVVVPIYFFVPRQLLVLPPDLSFARIERVFRRSHFVVNRSSVKTRAFLWHVLMGAAQLIFCNVPHHQLARLKPRFFARIVVVLLT